MSYVVLRGRWCNIIFLNVHSPSKAKSDDLRDSFYEDLDQVFVHFTKYHKNILLGEFNAKVGRKNISNRQLGKRVYIRMVMIMVLE